MGVWRNFGMVSSSVKDVFFFNIRNIIRKWCFPSASKLLLHCWTGQEKEGSLRTGIGLQKSGVSPPALDGLDVAGASWCCWRATWICWRPKGSETTRSCLVHHPQIDIISINIIEEYVRNYHVPSSIGGNWSSSIFEKNTIFHFSIVIVIVFPKYIQC